MTIEIHRPELEALIRERMKNGAFQDVEDVLMEALESWPLSAGKEGVPSDEAVALTGEDLIRAMQASPYKEIDLVPQRDRLPVREPSF